MTSTARERTQPEVALETRDQTTLGPILVASDGSDESTAALRAAALLEQRTNAEVIVLSVLEGLPPVAADFGIAVPPIDADDTRRARRMETIRHQVSEIPSRVREWKVEVSDGDPSQIIARTARELNARVIVIGIGHHQVLDRLFGRETALHVLRQARTPVLAVPEHFDRLPERVVVATDFSPESLNAARVALRLFDSVNSVHVAHVAPRIDVRPDAFAAWMTVFSEGIAPAFGRLKQELEVSPGIEFESRTLSGGASRAVLEFAEEVGADLITCGSSGAGLVDRILVGSTATGILRGAQCAVFAVPATGIDRGRSWKPGQTTTVHRDDWAQALEEFSKRNEGRRASLEVDDPDVGAQAQERDYPFQGISWDHNDERIQIMLGDLTASGRHLTRSIAGVTGVDIVTDEDGNERLLRIRHGSGQTILSMQPSDGTANTSPRMPRKHRG